MKHLKLIREFFDKNDTSYYFLNLDDLWKTYLSNFNELYPEVDIRNKQKDIKIIAHYYRIDVHQMLKGKEIDVPNLFPTKIGKISDVWTRYFGAINFKWEYKFKVEGTKKWIVNKNEILKVYNNIPKTELEEKLEFLSTAKKYNL
jgi:hypothetical protein